MDFDPEYSSISPTTLASNWASSVTNVTLYIGAQLTTNQTAYAGLTTSNLNHYVNSGTYTVTGTITNTGSQTVGERLGCDNVLRRLRNSRSHQLHKLPGPIGLSHTRQRRHIHSHPRRQHSRVNKQNSKLCSACRIHGTVSFLEPPTPTPMGSQPTPITYANADYRNQH